MSSFRNYLQTDTSTLSEDEVEGAAVSLISLLTPYSEDPKKELNRMPRDLVTCLTKTYGTAVSTVNKAKCRILDSDLNTAKLQSGTFRTNCHTGRLHMTRMAADYLMAQSEKEGSQAQTSSKEELLGLKEYSLSANRTLQKVNVAMEAEITTPQRKTKLSKTSIMIPPSQVDNMEAFIQQAPEKCFGPLDDKGSSPRTAMSTKLNGYFSVDGKRSGVMYTKGPTVALKAVKKSNTCPGRWHATMGPLYRIHEVMPSNKSLATSQRTHYERISCVVTEAPVRWTRTLNALYRRPCWPSVTGTTRNRRDL
jgi:hypothetical protein